MCCSSSCEGGGQWESAGYFYWAKKVHLCLTFLDPHYFSHRADGKTEPCRSITDSQSSQCNIATGSDVSALHPLIYEIMVLILENIFYSFFLEYWLYSIFYSYSSHLWLLPLMPHSILGRPIETQMWSLMCMCIFLTIYADKKKIQSVYCPRKTCFPVQWSAFFAHHNKCQRWKRLDN